MEPENLTVRLLQEIRDDARASAKETRAQFEKIDQRFEKMDQRFEKMDQRFEKMDQRFEVIETTLRDLAQQLVMLARGIKTALEHRASVDSRMDAFEQRLAALEKSH
jgi:chromosome segregation ATPase